MCILLGVVPVLPLVLLYGVARQLIGASIVPPYGSLFGTSATAVTLSFGAGVSGIWNPAVVVAALAVCSLIAFAISRRPRAISSDRGMVLRGRA